MQIKIKLWHVVFAQLLFIASLVWAADSRITDLTELTNGNVAAGDFVECVDVSDTTDNAAGSSRKCKINSIETAVHAAGSATADSWPVFGSGTLLTTAEDGALEQDGNAFYLTTDAGNRGYVPVKNFIRQDADYTLTSQTAAQKIFNASTNGRLTLETGTYKIECIVHLNTMSATSGNGQFGLLGAGTATLGTQAWIAGGVDAASGTVGGGGWTGVQGSNTSGASAVTAATGTAVTMFVNGSFEVTVAGTVQPSIALVTAAAAVVKAGSFCEMNRIGSTTLTTIGQWD